MEGTSVKYATYHPDVCPNKDCMGYGDTVPAEHNKCFMCYTELVPYTHIPYEDVNEFVRKVIEHVKDVYGE